MSVVLGRSRSGYKLDRQSLYVAKNTPSLYPSRYGGDGEGKNHDRPWRQALRLTQVFDVPLSMSVNPVIVTHSKMTSPFTVEDSPSQVGNFTLKPPITKTCLGAKRLTTKESTQSSKSDRLLFPHTICIHGHGILPHRRQRRRRR